MNTQSNTMPDTPIAAQGFAPAVIPESRLLYWSVMRELWESRSIYVAPLAVAALTLVGHLIATIGRAMSVTNLAQRGAILEQHYSFAEFAIMGTTFVVAVFYCLDALHGERRDRSILFWKSLPVSDLTTVLSKASIPLVVLPLLVFAITVALQLIMWLLSSASLLMRGVSAATVWTRLPLFQMELVLLYGLIVLALWHAPLYGWLLLVSGWARRTAFLWAVLPLLAICAVEWMAFHTSYFGSLLKDRLFGFAADAFAFTTQDGSPVDPHFIPLAQLTPGKFLSTPGLWIGLAVAAAFLAAAVRLRRYREPI